MKEKIPYKNPTFKKNTRVKVLVILHINTFLNLYFGLQRPNKYVLTNSPKWKHSLLLK